MELLTPDRLEQSAKNAMVLWDAIALGLGLIAVLIGALSIVTVMMLSVMERVKEIGIKRVAGASRLDIFFEFLTQAFLMGVIGGCFGIGMAFGFIHIFGLWLQERGMTLFDFSPLTLALLLVGASFLGIAGGSVPAYIASGFQPLRALKGER